eukprot:TRINITY_DN208_c0_g1_i1.p1 TRINITY_DN208_c0_g1~~TRINITY_DN208_c0_g1_i1.p1  ORF type:complete len:521 (+),score=133.36 TRINITY_DN208_c0_g1_i1:35-1564(+)
MARTFDHVKPVSAAVQLLEKQLLSADPLVRRSGADSVPRLRAPTDQIQDLAKKLLKHENWYARSASVDAIVLSVLHQGSKHAEKSIELAATSLEDEDGETRRCGGRALVSIAEQPVEPRPPTMLGDAIPAPTPEQMENADRLSELAAAEVAKRLQDKRRHVRENAVVTLAKLGKWAAPHATVLASLLGDEVTVRHGAIRAVEQLGAIVSEGAPEMAKWFESPDTMIRNCGRQALLALARSDGKAAADATVVYLDSKDVVARRAAAQCLVELGGYAAPHAERIGKLLEDENQGLRVMSTRILVAAGTAEPKLVAKCVRSVCKRMEHPNIDVRRASLDCVRALASIIDKFARAQGRLFLEDMAGVDAETFTRRKLNAIQVIGGAGPNAEPYLEYIAKELESKEWRLRRAALHCFVDLGKYASGVGVKEVCKRLLHEEPDVRRLAAETVGKMGIHVGGYSHRVEASLDAEEDPDVREAIQTATKLLQQAGAMAMSEPDSPAGGKNGRRGSGF